MYIESDSPINVGGNNGNGGFGFGNNDAWVLIILFALIFGWNGNNGFGNNGSAGAANNYVLASDFATLQRQLSDGFGNLTDQTRFIQNGLCDGFYAMNTSLLNGFAGVNNAIMTNGYETRNAIQGVSNQLADCCCKTQSAIQGVNYNMAMQTNAIEKSLCDGFRSIRDEITANRIEDKNAQIAAQQNEINKLQLAASQSAQNAYLINTLRPVAQPAYITCSPYQSLFGYGTCGNTCGNTCGSVV